MIPVPLIGGGYQARSVIANAQRCVNYFPEPNRRDSPFPMTHYQRPGFRPKIVPTTQGACRCLYQATNGAAYAVIGSTVYSVDSAWTLTPLGSVSGLLDTPVSMIDNGTSVVIVDGSANQWSINLLTNAFALIVDGTGNFAGGTRVDYLDGFICWNRPSSPFWGATFDQLLTTDIFSRGRKATYADNISTLIARRTEMFVLGRLKGEIWYNTGGALFPFSRLPGAYIEYGCSAPYSVAAQDLNVYWFSSSLEGVGQVMKLKGYEAKPITSFALANAIQAMTVTSDAIGYCYQQNGHQFYVIHFPTEDQTWVYDETISEPELAWHQRAWTDTDGVLHRDRSNCFAVINGVPCVGDWENGTIYQLDPDYYLDTVLGLDYDITFIRGFPQITQAYNAKGEIEKAGGKSVTFHAVMADMDVGNAALVGTAQGQVGLRWSDDRGKIWSQTVMIGNGTPGQYSTNLKWPGLGLSSKERVFEIRHSLRGKAALNGLFVHAVINNV